MLQKAQNAVDDGQPFDLEYRIERADGELRWVLDRGHRVKGPRGEEWMDGAIFDITERRANEEALRAHEVERARLKELRASQARIIEAADAARRRDRARPARRRAAAPRRARARGPPGAGARRARPVLGRRLPRARGRGARRRPRPSCASWPTASIPPSSPSAGWPRRSQALAGRATVPVEVLETPGRAAAAADRGRRLLRRRRGADQRRQVRAGVGRDGEGDGRPGRASWSRSSDDGVGGASPETGSGLRGLADRVGALDGTLTVVSPRGRGHAAARRHPSGRALSDSAKSSSGSVRTSRSSRPAAARSAPRRLTRELRADLGAQLLARREGDVEAERADVHVHPPLGAQAHLDPLALAVEEGDVLEGVDVEVGVELAVDDAQDVAVELGGDARRCRRRRPRAPPGP